MKTLKNILAIIVVTAVFASCTPTTDINEENPTEYNINDGDDDSGTEDGRD